ncbi:nucleoside hydrolase [Lederbergia graminis]|uniref:Nucleoside hydrolase n=1 Tax=Lederbergia graminis TaxID=735518 RepID=A0ABW0LF40_9BACI|nr:nucleoside hydrolase [Paenibacillus bovis]HLU22310.1 nucleoside hydrolase [Bacillaceae bacterium]
MKKILLFGDPGIDDAIAIMYCLLHPELDLVGVVTGYGNVTEEQARDNTAFLLSLAGREDIPIIGGAKGPFSGEFVTYYPEIHGSDGLGPIKVPEDINPKVFGFQKAIDIINEYKNELTIVDTGRSTSLAMAFILAGDEVVNSVNSIFSMGGAFLYPGNITAVAEANYYGDPIASNLVLEKGRNVTIIPLNITNKAVVDQEMLQYIKENADNPFKNILDATLRYYDKAYEELIPGLAGPPVHDVLTLYAVIAPEQFVYVNRRVTIDTSEQSRGRTIADFRANPDEEPAETIDKIAFDFNYNEFKADFLKTMIRAI